MYVYIMYIHYTLLDNNQTTMILLNICVDYSYTVLLFLVKSLEDLIVHVPLDSFYNSQMSSIGIQPSDDERSELTT